MKLYFSAYYSRLVSKKGVNHRDFMTWSRFSAEVKQKIRGKLFQVEFPHMFLNKLSMRRPGSVFPCPMGKRPCQKRWKCRPYSSSRSREC